MGGGRKGWAFWLPRCLLGDWLGISLPVGQYNLLRLFTPSSPHPSPFPSPPKLYLPRPTSFLAFALSILSHPTEGRAEGQASSCVGAVYGHLTTLDKCTPVKRGMCGTALICIFIFF